MAQLNKSDHVAATTHKAWLELAEEVKRETATVDVYRHAPVPGASVEQLRELAGIIRLHGPLPSSKFLEDAGDAE